MGEVTFTDGPPYELRAVQDAEAKAVGASVELALFTNPPDRPLAVVPILARKLRDQF